MTDVHETDLPDSGAQIAKKLNAHFALKMTVVCIPPTGSETESRQEAAYFDSLLSEEAEERQVSIRVRI